MLKFFSFKPAIIKKGDNFEIRELAYNHKYTKVLHNQKNYLMTENDDVKGFYDAKGHFKFLTSKETQKSVMLLGFSYKKKFETTQLLTPEGSCVCSKLTDIINGIEHLVKVDITFSFPELKKEFHYQVIEENGKRKWIKEGDILNIPEMLRILKANC